MPIGETLPFKLRPNRRRNQTKRNKSMVWTEFHEGAMNEILEKFPVKLKPRNRRAKGRSLVVTTSLSLCQLYVRWHTENIKGMPEEFFQSLPFAEAVRWWKNLQGQAHGKDAKKVVEDSYGVQS